MSINTDLGCVISSNTLLATADNTNNDTFIQQLSVSEQLKQAMIEKNITPPEVISADGSIHRFSTNGKRGDLAGWYVLYPGSVIAGAFGCWRDKEESYNFRQALNRPLTPYEEAELKRTVENARIARETEIKEQHEKTAEKAREILANAKECKDNDHPYLMNKGVNAHGIKIDVNNNLLIPIGSVFTGKISSVQTISPSGSKRFLYQSSTKGGFFTIGEPKPNEQLYFCEGYATGATLYETLLLKNIDACVIVCFSAKNLKAVATEFRKISPTTRFIIIGDNDESGVGQTCAKEAAKETGASVIISPAKSDINDFVQENGKEALLPILFPEPSKAWFISGSDLINNIKPISWIVKGWIPTDSLAMIHGAPACGKTFITLDWLLRIATGLENWQGFKVKPGSVIYLAGEGHAGLSPRLKAWAQTNGTTDLSNIVVSPMSLNMDEPMQLDFLVTQIKATNLMPSIIVVDTLNRHLSGDENSAQDTKKFLDSCAVLRREFGCTVLIVHHTGVSETAQHRARGSSAWQGALDAEISVEKDKDTGIITLTQMKMKDAEVLEPLKLMLKAIELDGVFDEDGNSIFSPIVIEGNNANRKLSTQELEDIEELVTTFLEVGATYLGDKYITKNNWKDYLMKTKKKSQEAAWKYLRKDKDRPVGKWIDRGILEEKGGSFYIRNNQVLDMINLRKQAIEIGENKENETVN